MIENYDSPDGEYTDITRKFDGEEWAFAKKNDFHFTREYVQIKHVFPAWNMDSYI